jgi:hypothetical protein
VPYQIPAKCELRDVIHSFAVIEVEFALLTINFSCSISFCPSVGNGMVVIIWKALEGE